MDSRLARIVKAAQRALPWPRSGGMSLGGVRGGFNYARSIGDAQNASVIEAPIRWIQRTLPEAPFRLRRPNSDGVLEPVTDHRMIDLLNRPNPYYDGIKLLQATIASLETDGNAYWHKVRNGQGAVIELWWLPHNLIEPKQREGDTAFITHYEYKPEGYPIAVPIQDIVHFRRGLDPNNPRKGRSPLKALVREIFTDEEAANFSASLLRNMGVPGVIISPAATDEGLWTGAEDIKTTKRMFRQLFGGDNRGEAMVMSAPTRIEQFGFNPQQMNLRDLRRIPEERVTACIGVPAVVCGLGAGLDRSTFANFAEAREAAYESKVIPDQREIAAEVQHHLLPDFEGVEIAARMTLDFDTSDVRVLQDDENKMAARVQSLLVSGAITVAEAREPFGYEIDDSHKIFLRPLNLIETPADGAPPSEGASPASPGQTTGDNGGAPPAKQSHEMCPICGMANVEDCPCPTYAGSGNGVGKMLAQIPLSKAPHRQGDTLSPAKLRSFMRSLQRHATTLERGFTKRLEARFAELGDLAVTAYRDATAAKASDPDSVLIHEMIARLDLVKWRDDTLGVEFAGHYSEVSGSVLSTVDTSLGIVLSDADPVEQAMIRRGYKRAKIVTVPEQTERALLGAFEEARAVGLGPIEIERLIRSYVEAGGKQANVSSRALRIARTETLHAQRMACLESYQASGAFGTVIAFDNQTDFNDPDCMQRDQTEYSFMDAETEAENEHPYGTLSFAPGSLTGESLLEL